MTSFFPRLEAHARKGDVLLGITFQRQHNVIKAAEYTKQQGVHVVRSPAKPTVRVRWHGVYHHDQHLSALLIVLQKRCISSDSYFD
jgi:hypothetical protein